MTSPKTPKPDAAPESLGTAKVQDPNGPDVLDANNTGRVGDAREYDALAAAAPKPDEGFKAGQTAPSTKYADLNGKITGTAGEGFRGSVVVAKGDVVNTAQAAQLAAK
jgi:hypothetical protein